MDSSPILKESPLFAGLEPRVLREIAAVFGVESFRKGAQILVPADTSKYFRIVTRGRVKVTRSNSQNARELTLWLLGPGDGFDVVSLLDGEPHDASAWAVDDVSTLAASMVQLRSSVARHPTLQLAVDRYVAHKFREITELAGDLALHGTVVRLARLLLRHFDGPQKGDSRRENLLRHLAQDEIAALVGSVRVVVSRQIAALKRHGVVEGENGTLARVELSRLRSLAELAESERRAGRIRPR